MLTDERGVNGDAGDALAEPLRDQLSIGRKRRLAASVDWSVSDTRGGASAAAISASGGKGRVSSSQRLSRANSRNRAAFGSAHQTGARNLTLRIAVTQTHQDLAVLVHLDTPAGHRLPPAKPGRVAMDRERSRRPSA